MAQPGLASEPEDDLPEEQPATPKKKGNAKPPDLLAIVREEMRRAIGFENDQTLFAERQRALEYYKGTMKDVTALENRSQAVSSDLADAIETILPDLMEIFTGGDDVAAFVPTKQQDEEQAKQETDYLNHVVFHDNPGFLNFYTAFKDALLLKTCIFKFGWEKDIKDDDEDFTGKNAVELQLAAQSGQVTNVRRDPIPMRPSAPDQSAPLQETFSFTLRKTEDRSNAWFEAVAPDDFAVSQDTIRISDTTYCVHRSRPRRQDLIAEGYDEEKVRVLEPYGAEDQQTQVSRDTAGEHLISMRDDSTNDLTQVEIRDHYVKVLSEDNEICIWRIVTDVNATTELDSEEVDRIPFAAGSPYLISHRFYGQSLADKLFELQRIKTVLTRAVLDSTYFGLNQRTQVSENEMSDYTISDLLRNEPGMPVRSKTGEAVKPLGTSGLNFDAYAALEYFSTVAEMRTGVVRNAQGLNPDTLHDTAKGAMALLSAAQKRIRMIARILAETCIKELFLGLHAVIRENATSERIVKLSGKWLQVNPAQWAERTAMTIEVGLGAAGRDVEMAALQTVGEIQAAIVKEQGGAEGPIVTGENVYQAAIAITGKAGIKAPERFFSDPSQAPPQPPKQSPEMMKVQGDQQMAQAKMQFDQQAQTQQMQSEMALQQQKLQAEQAMATQKAQTQAIVDQHLNELEHARDTARIQGEMELEQLKIASAERIAIEVARINAEAKIESARISAKNQTDDGAAELAYQQSHENA